MCRARRAEGSAARGSGLGTGPAMYAGTGRPSEREDLSSTSPSGSSWDSVESSGSGTENYLVSISATGLTESQNEQILSTMLRKRWRPSNDAPRGMAPVGTLLAPVEQTSPRVSRHASLTFHAKPDGAG